MSNLTNSIVALLLSVSIVVLFFIEKCMPESRNFCQVHLTIKLAMILSFLFFRLSLFYWESNVSKKTIISTGCPTFSSRVQLFPCVCVGGGGEGQLLLL